MSLKERFGRGSGLATVLSLAVFISGVLMLVIGGFDEESIKLVKRFTMRACMLLFVITFATSSLKYFFKSDFTKWLMRNRRYLGIAFAMAFFMHFTAIMLRGVMFPEDFGNKLSFSSTISALPLIATVFLLTVTSSNRVIRRMHPKLWKYLHLVGCYYIYARLFGAYWNISRREEAFYLVVVLMVCVIALRVAKFVHRRIGLVARRAEP